VTVTRRRLRVTGTVQGVGYRPFVYRHAVDLGLTGWVRNDSAGVLIDVEGEEDVIEALQRLLVHEAPPLARVTSVTAEAVVDDAGSGRAGAAGFEIVESDDAGLPAAAVSVDTATCDDCMAEVLDPGNRRYRYPFTNCTNCGPRYTIVRSVPYDRPATTMAGFAMCPACLGEYHDPADRRFHAQPNACAVCGPQLAWIDLQSGFESARDDALCAAVDALLAGKIIGVKGIGGYHLAVDATDANAVRELRRRKSRDDKPFAVMAADGEAAAALVEVDDATVQQLTSPRRPIVLAPWRHGTSVADAVAPGLPELGVMLPYTPLHHLLLGGVGRPLVMTSGNLSDEPIAHEDGDAATRLASLVDGLLSHNRPILIRCDDSVARVARGRSQVLRRSRGHAPEPLALPFEPDRSVLALGAELKSTIAVTKGPSVVPSHHLGDLEHLATYTSFLQAVEHLPALYGVRPDVVAHDLHPEYLSSKYALDLDLPAIAVQHHHAHVAACMVEHGRTEPVIGVAYDGLGYGPDGTMWGGEVLVADFAGFERVARLRAAPMPGGVAAIREPWRMAVVWAQRAGLDPGRVIAPIDGATLDAVLALAARSDAVTTTSAGRLFDAVAVLLGGRTHVTYEAQAAIELEALARSAPRSRAPIYEVDAPAREGTAELDPSPMIAAIARDVARGVDRASLAAGFHESFGRATVALAARTASDHDIDTVVLTGGVFQNALLTDVIESGLVATGVRVLIHAVVPPNDGGICVGQAAIAGWRLRAG
jgi:hydrogenase maturation protein HypF